MSAALSLLIAVLSFLSTSAKTAQDLTDSCPTGAVIDRVEGDRVVLVHGSAGVRSIATSAISRGQTRLSEGLRVRRTPSGQCVLDGTDRALDTSVRDRLRALERGARRDDRRRAEPGHSRHRE